MSILKQRLRNRLLRAAKGGGRLHPVARENLHALDNLDEQAPASQAGYVVVDLETTGLDLEKDRVVSVGAVRMRAGRVLLGQVFHELVNPGRDIPAESIRIHGITPQEIERARHGALVLEDFVSFLGHDVLVAHYARFDLHFINMVMRERFGLPLQNLVLDTVSMCQAVVLPSDPYGIERHKKRCGLEALAARFGLSSADRHTSLGDAVVTAQIFQRMLARLAQVGRGRLKDLVRVAQV